MNISDGNSTTTFRSRLIKWMITGTAMAASAPRKAGARKFIDYALPDARKPLARQQIREQRLIERLRRIHHHIVGARFPNPLRQHARMLGDDLLVLLSEILRDHRHL